MMNLPTARHKHFIAINAHEGHTEHEAFVCCASVMRSVAPLVRQKGTIVRIILFYHANELLAPQSKIVLAEMGIKIIEHPASANGTALNIQLDLAIACGFDFFYRVDADDTVFACRFPRQSKLLIGSDMDICGGGLLYREKHAKKSFLVMPRPSPRPMDYLANQYILHPTIALRLETIKRLNIRYWAQRLEDKQLALKLDACGLTIQNDQAVYGVYNLNRNARNHPSFAALNLKLNLEFLKQNQIFLATPQAIVLYVLHRFLPNHILRVMRCKLGFLRYFKTATQFKMRR